MFITQSVRAPDPAAAEVLRVYWDQQLPVRVDTIAHQLGIALNPVSNMGYSGHYYAADDPVNSLGVPLIQFNTSDSATRQRFTIAHELGHHVLGHGTSPRDTSNTLNAPWDPCERAANQFAASLLMPAEVVQFALDRGYSSVHDLAQLFGVSTAAMGYRLINLGLDR